MRPLRMLLNTPRICRTLYREGRHGLRLRRRSQDCSERGMPSFDSALIDLVRMGKSDPRGGVRSARTLRANLEARLGFGLSALRRSRLLGFRLLRNRRNRV
jgi:Tfp pilus assembly ATPase PilU